MLDRASTFADKEIIEILKSDFIPVAIDQAYQRRQKDAEGRFYRKIAGKGPRHDFENGTTQGLYAAGPDGAFLGYNNSRGPGRVKQMLQKALSEFRPSEVDPIDDGTPDARYNPQPPVGGLVVRVQSKVLGGYEKAESQWNEIFQTSVSRDNLWITREEHKALAVGQFPQSLQKRLARFHLVDNTRGEPPMWKEKEIRQMQFTLKDGQLEGSVGLKTDAGDRGYDSILKGNIKVESGVVTSFELIAQGDFWGEGQYTKRAPKGKFPLAISFTLADGSDIADRVPPQASRGWVEGYINTN